MKKTRLQRAAELDKQADQKVAAARRARKRGDSRWASDELQEAAKDRMHAKRLRENDKKYRPW